MHSVDGKEIRCCCGSVCTCVIMVQHKATKISLLGEEGGQGRGGGAPGVEDMRQTVVHVAVSIDLRLSRTATLAECPAFQKKEKGRRNRRMVCFPMLVQEDVSRKKAYCR